MKVDEKKVVEILAILLAPLPNRKELEEHLVKCYRRDFDTDFSMLLTALRTIAA